MSESLGRREFLAWMGGASLLFALDSHSADALGMVEVYKNASCECCVHWVEHLRRAGFSVTVHETEDLQQLKQQLGVPPMLASCHTAKVGRYFIEGHVPAQDIRRLLKENPQARGLIVPSMPLGSPGMESASGRTMPYEVFLIDSAGERHVYARYK